MRVQNEINKKNALLGLEAVATATVKAGKGIVKLSKKGLNCAKKGAIATFKGIKFACVFVADAVIDGIDGIKEIFVPDVYKQYIKATKDYKDKIGTVEKLPNGEYVAYTPEGPIIANEHGYNCVGYAKTKVGLFRHKYLFTAISESHYSGSAGPLYDTTGYTIVEGVIQTSSGLFVRKRIMQFDDERSSGTIEKLRERNYDLQGRFVEAFESYPHITPTKEIEK